MHSLVRLITYRNSLKTNIRLILVYHRHLEIDKHRTERTYSTKKDDIIDKLDNLEQKIQSIVRKKTIDCLEAKCKQADTSLPDCSASEVVVDPGRRHQVPPIPLVCPPKPDESDPCIRPYVNPCPPHPLKICSTICGRPVDPCLVPCKKPKYQTPKDKKIMELDLRMMRILFALTTLLAAYVLYKLYALQEDKDSDITEEDKKMPKYRKPLKYPQYSIELPNKAPYIIVGGGTAGHAAIKKILELDSDAKILIISKDLYNPYNKGPLNTELIEADPEIAKDLRFIPHGIKKKIKPKRDAVSIFFEKDEFYTPIADFEKKVDEPGHTVTIARGWEVTKVNSVKKTVEIEGKIIKYDKCIIATGSSPKQLGVFTENSEDVQKRVSTYTTVYDYKVLNEIIDTYNGDLTIAIVGGGLNGSELACSLARRGVRVIQIYEEHNNMGRLLPGYLAEWLTKRIVNLGVTVIPESHVLDASIWKGGEHDGNIALYIGNKQSTKNYLVFADHVLVSIGNTPNTNLAGPSGFELDEVRGGFVVNSELQIARDLYAAGDCISYYDSVYGRRHFEHFEHAIETGKTAAHNLLSEGQTYNYQTLIWSDLLEDLGFEAVGTIDSSMPTVGIYVVGNKSEKIKENPGIHTEGNEKESSLKLEEFNKGIVFYLDNKEIIAGILTWNIYGRANMLRRILRNAKRYEDCDELAKIMNIHNP